MRAILTLVAVFVASLVFLAECNEIKHPWDEPSKLTKAELKKLHQYMKKMMKKVDTTGDGTVSLDEVKKNMNKGFIKRMKGDDAMVLQNARKKGPKKHKSLDLNGDGGVDYQEMFVHDKSWEKEDQFWTDHQKKVFHLADRDKDGKLNVTEIITFLHPEVTEHKQEYNEMMSKDHMAQVDKDKDGHITWDEHWFHVTDGHDFSEGQLADLDETERDLVKKHDADGDGKLNFTELHDLLFPDIHSIDFSGPNAVHVHSIADKNGDGQLDWEEIKKSAEMLSSAFADHGEL